MDPLTRTIQGTARTVTEIVGSYPMDPLTRTIQGPYKTSRTSNLGPAAAVPGVRIKHVLEQPLGRLVRRSFGRVQIMDILDIRTSTTKDIGHPGNQAFHFLRPSFAPVKHFLDFIFGVWEACVNNGGEPREPAPWPSGGECHRGDI